MTAAGVEEALEKLARNRRIDAVLLLADADPAAAAQAIHDEDPGAPPLFVPASRSRAATCTAARRRVAGRPAARDRPRVVGRPLDRPRGQKEKGGRRAAPKARADRRNPRPSSLRPRRGLPREHVTHRRKQKHESSKGLGRQRRHRARRAGSRWPVNDTPVLIVDRSGRGSPTRSAAPLSSQIDESDVVRQRTGRDLVPDAAVARGAPGGRRSLPA